MAVVPMWEVAVEERLCEKGLLKVVVEALMEGVAGVAEALMKGAAEVEALNELVGALE